jgi:hypothetical protein
MPASLLLDSDILIDHLRKEQKALEYLQREIDAGSCFSPLLSAAPKYSREREKVKKKRSRAFLIY